MLRVLLVIDDYGELVYLQTLLKKLGFDVDGIQNERNFEESQLALNPEVVVLTAKGRMVNGLDLAENLRKVRGLPKIIILAPRPLLEKLRSQKLVNVDALLETPVGAISLLTALAEGAGLDRDSLIEKYKRLKASLSHERESDLQILRRDQDESDNPAVGDEASEVKLSPSLIDDVERKGRFQKSLRDLDTPSEQFFPKDRVSRFIKEIRASEDPEELADLEAERQGFVKALFRRAKKK